MKCAGSYLRFEKRGSYLLQFNIPNLLSLNLPTRNYDIITQNKIAGVHTVSCKVSNKAAVCFRIVYQYLIAWNVLEFESRILV
jgi:hypothetical protein